MFILYIIFWVFTGYSIYMFLLVVAGVIYRPKSTGTEEIPKIKILLPAYKPDDVFINILNRLKAVTVGRDVEVFVLFQHAHQKYCDQAEQLGFNYERKTFDHLEGNSYRHVLQYLASHHIDEEKEDFVMILDKDNLIAKDFFQELEKIDLAGFDVVQGVRRPLEVGKGLQVFDALSERLNDLMLRAGKCFWGGALELSGSAALIKTSIFRHCIEHLDPKAPGFDKNFMVNMLTDFHSLKTQFNENLAVYEEKTEVRQNYESQRLRWFGEQYYNAFYNAGKLVHKTLKGNLNCLDYWIALSRPPRVVLFVVSFLLALVDLWDKQPGILSVAFVLNYLTFILVAFPFFDKIKIIDLLVGGWNVLRTNLVCSLNSLNNKYLGTFIHTR